MRMYSMSVIKGMRFGGFRLVTKFWVVVYQVSKRHMRPTKLSQALCVPDRDLLNYSPHEGIGEHKVCYYSHPLGATFHNVPPGTQVFQTL